jgi:Holliday junction resolvase RusA-like endonuclease
MGSTKTKPKANAQVTTTLHVENGALIWRVSGKRGRSPNRSRGQHWTLLREDKMLWLSLLMAAGGRHDVRHEWEPPFRCKLTIREWGTPARDLDNAVAAQKWLIDALVTANYIVDDNPKHLVDLQMKQPDERPVWIEGNKRTPAVEIMVERVA